MTDAPPELPDDALTRVLDRVWCSATDATASPDFASDTARERYRAATLLQARAALSGGVAEATGFEPATVLPEPR